MPFAVMMRGGKFYTFHFNGFQLVEEIIFGCMHDQIITNQVTDTAEKVLSLDFFEIFFEDFFVKFR